MLILFLYDAHKDCFVVVVVIEHLLQCVSYTDHSGDADAKQLMLRMIYWLVLLLFSMQLEIGMSKCTL